jgi:hypothetical protein
MVDTQINLAKDDLLGVVIGVATPWAVATKK